MFMMPSGTWRSFRSERNAGQTLLFHRGVDSRACPQRHTRSRNKQHPPAFDLREHIQFTEDFQMGRGILLWLLGIPLPIVILLVLFMR